MILIDDVVIFIDDVMIDDGRAHNGSEMLCCSWDGTVAYASFTEEEIGRPISQKAKEDLLQELYGKTALIYKGKSSKKPLICESVEQLGLLERDDKYAGLSEVQKHKKVSKELQLQHHNDLASLCDKKKPEKQRVETRQSFLELPEASLSSSSKVRHRFNGGVTMWGA